VLRNVRLSVCQSHSPSSTTVHLWTMVTRTLIHSWSQSHSLTWPYRIDTGSSQNDSEAVAASEAFVRWLHYTAVKPSPGGSVIDMLPSSAVSGGMSLPPPKKEVMFLVRSVCLSVCPSDYSQTCERILTKFFVGVGHG